MEKEISKLQAILQKDPANFQARRELSILLADNGFNEEALSNLQYLSKYFPEDAELHYNLGILNEKLKNFEDAKASYLKAIEISPQEDFYYNLGEVLVNLQEWDNAIFAFKTVLKTDPNDGNCYFNLGVCYYNKDEINLATDYFQQAVNHNPKDIFAHFYLGNIYQNNGLTNFAIESYQKVLNISPDYSWAYFNLAAIAYKNENLEEAKEYLLKTIQYNPNDTEAYKLLTKICVKLEEFEEIITILETKLKDAENGDIFYTLAQVYKTIGDVKNYTKNLGLALENSLTLSYPKKIVETEFNYNNEKLLKETTIYKDDSRYADYQSEEEENLAFVEDAKVTEDWNNLEDYTNNDDEIRENEEEN